MVCIQVLRWLSVVAALGAIVAGARAQIATPPPAPASIGAEITASSSVLSYAALYRLEDDAAFEEGCYPPCLCPVFFTGDLRGTMRLSPSPAWSASVQEWVISEVNWYHTLGSEIRRVVGRGTYTRTNLPGAPPSHRLRLALRVEDEPEEAYDSGDQPLASPPSTDLPVFDLWVSKHGMFCYDRAFRVATAPVPREAVTPYSVAGTRYIEGCFPPCLCPIMFMFDVRGGFDLVDLGGEQGSRGFALVNCRWAGVPTPASPPFPLRAAGYGVYRRASPTILPVLQEEAVLDLVINGTPGRLRAPLEPVSDPWPIIDIDVSEHGFYCYDRVFEILASPAP